MSDCSALSKLSKSAEMSNSRSCQDDSLIIFALPNTTTSDLSPKERLKRELDEVARVGQACFFFLYLSFMGHSYCLETLYVAYVLLWLRVLMDAHTFTIVRKRRSVDQSSSLTFSLQDLLTNHEAYVADAESRHKTDRKTVTTLTNHNTALESMNARVTHENDCLTHENDRLTYENKDLSAQVDHLNDALQESDTQIQNLTTTLRQTQNELARMRILTARAERLEKQLVQVEMERETLRDTVIQSEEDQRRANSRWRASERTIHHLEAQIKSMEAEAEQEREAQKEAAERAERRHQAQISTEARRKRTEQEAINGSHEVIASFVKEILEENAGLQIDLAELRGMVGRSQEEAEDLRQQLMLAGPLPVDTASQPLDLQAELQKLSGELHVHHHIHAPQGSTKSSTSGSLRTMRSVSSRHRRHFSSRSSSKTIHVRGDSTASSNPSTVLEHISSASEAGYETDTTNITRPTSSDSAGLSSGYNTSGALTSPTSLGTPFTPLDGVLTTTATKRPHPIQRTASSASVMSVYGMDIHAPPLPSASSKRTPARAGRKFNISTGTARTRPMLSNSHATSSTSISGAAAATDAGAAGRALRRRLEEEGNGPKGYNPMKDTFGGWFARGKKARQEEWRKRRPAARAMTEVVDMEGLRECLEEE